MLLLQFALICHSSSHIAEKSMISKDSTALDRSLAGLAFAGQGTLRLVVSFTTVWFLLEIVRRHITTLTAVPHSISEPADTSLRCLWLVFFL